MSEHKAFYRIIELWKDGQVGRFVVRMNKVAPKNDAEVERFISDLDRMFVRKKKFILVIDTTDLPWSFKNAKWASRFASWMKRNRPLIVDHLEQSVVVSSWTIRQFIKLVFSLQPPAKPNKLVGSMGEAIEQLGWNRQRR